MRKAMAAAMAAAMIVVLAAGLAQAGVPVEKSKLSGAKITLYLHPFLTEEEVMTLRLVASNKDALKLFVPSDAGFAAIALAPDEGFVRNGQPVASAFAIAGLPDAATAAAAALQGCEAARKTGPACVIVMEIGH